MTVNRTFEVIEKIKQRRIELDLSYQNLADKTGLSKSTLHRYEEGYVRNLSIDKLEVIAEALEVTPSYLMGLEETSYYCLKVDSLETLTKQYLKNLKLKNLIDYNIENLNKDQLAEFSDELLRQIKLMGYKYK